MLPGLLRAYLATGLGFEQERRVAVLLLAEMDEDGLLSRRLGERRGTLGFCMPPLTDLGCSAGALG